MSDNLMRRKIDVARLPETAALATGAAVERLRLPQPPVAVTLDRLAIERLALGTDILGETVEAAIAGRAVLRGDTAESRARSAPHRRRSRKPRARSAPARRRPGLGAENDSERADRAAARPVAQSRRPASLACRCPAKARSRTGTAVLRHPPGTCALAGDMTISAARATMVALTGTAAVAPLLPPEMACTDRRQHAGHGARR